MGLRVRSFADSGTNFYAAPFTRSATCSPPRPSIPSVSVARCPMSSEGRLSGCPTAAAIAFVSGPAHKIPRIACNAYPAQATTPVLKRVRALRLGLVDISLRLNERKRCGEFGLVFLRFVGEEHTNDAFGGFCRRTFLQSLGFCLCKLV